jgi:hypothetical protein
MDQIVPLTTAPNQTFPVNLAINGAQLTLYLSLSFNEMAGYWVMLIADQNRNVLLTDIPLLTGAYPAANILNQYGYMEIGDAYVLNVGSVVDADYPNAFELGTQFILLWGDNV